MNEYLEQYFDLLINTSDIEVIKTFLPTIRLDQTNKIIDLLIVKLEEELQLAIELDDYDYKKHIADVINLLQSKKEKKIEFVSNNKENTLIFSPYFLKSLKKLNDSTFYNEVIKAIESLTSKEWLKNNGKNSQKYRRLHGAASGLSEIKTNNIRLMHMPINSDFWYVMDVVKKEGNNKVGHQEYLINLKNLGENDIEKIINTFSIDGKINSAKLLDYSIKSNQVIMKELKKWGGRKK